MGYFYDRFQKIHDEIHDEMCAGYLTLENRGETEAEANAEHGRSLCLQSSFQCTRAPSERINLEAGLPVAIVTVTIAVAVIVTVIVIFIVVLSIVLFLYMIVLASILAAIAAIIVLGRQRGRLHVGMLEWSL